MIATGPGQNTETSRVENTPVGQEDELGVIYDNGELSREDLAIPDYVMRDFLPEKDEEEDWDYGI